VDDCKPLITGTPVGARVNALQGQLAMFGFDYNWFGPQTNNWFDRFGPQTNKVPVIRGENLCARHGLMSPRGLEVFLRRGGAR
jgi:hypothetical protein